MLSKNQTLKVLRVYALKSSTLRPLYHSGGAKIVAVVLNEDAEGLAPWPGECLPPSLLPRLLGSRREDDFGQFWLLGPCIRKHQVM